MHQLFVKQQLPLFAQLFQLTQRHAFGLCALDHFHNAKSAVLITPALHELLCVVGVVAKRPYVVLVLHDKVVKVIVHLHHVQDRAVKHEQGPFPHKLLILLPSRSRKLAEGVGCDVVPRLDPKISVGQRKQEGKGAEVVAHGKVRAHGTGHLPETSLPVAQGLLVGKEIGVALHGQVEALGQNIVPGAGGFLRTLHVQLVGLVAHGLAQVRVGFQPHLRLAHFLNGIQLVVPDGHMGVDVLPFQDAHQLHFDVVAAAVAHRALRGSRHDEVILVLGCTLFNGTNGVFPDVAGEPFVHGRHSVAPSLQLLNGHRAHFQKAVG